MTGPIFLIGYRGVGKTSVAEALSGQIGWPWVDADAALEKREGKSIRQIFAEEGEAAFRDLESKLLVELAQVEKRIVATGGGVVLRPENREQLKRGCVVWLTAPASVIWQRLQADRTTSERRPNLAQGGQAEVESLLAIREPLYRECATWIVDAANETPSSLAELIVRRAEPRERPGGASSHREA